MTVSLLTSVIGSSNQVYYSGLAQFVLEVRLEGRVREMKKAVGLTDQNDARALAVHLLFMKIAEVRVSALISLLSAH